MTFREFIEDLSQRLYLQLPANWAEMNEVDIARIFLRISNTYFFQTYGGIEKTLFQKDYLDYFSDFHHFWEANHREILGLQVNEERAHLVAQLFSNAVRQYGTDILGITHDTLGLSPQAIAGVRFFTANQDFRDPPSNQFTKYLEDNTQFNPLVIEQDPGRFINFMGLTSQSQSEKRVDFAKNAARFLRDRNINAYQIAAHYVNDAVAIRNAIVAERNMGYGLKKANMFLRDMYEWGVWPNLKNFDQIDVATDINLMKVALRTGLIHSEIPVLSSFLDIFCHQYESYYEITAAAWRAVWGKWRRFFPENAPMAPALMDFMIYRLGRDYCKSMVVTSNCEVGHQILNFTKPKMYCPVCLEEGNKRNLTVSKKCLPCQFQPQELPRENGALRLEAHNLLAVFDGVCPFEFACKPKTEKFRALDPPKSISIKGRTGWTSAYADRETGGGGLMS